MDFDLELKSQILYETQLHEDMGSLGRWILNVLYGFDTSVAVNPGGEVNSLNKSCIC